MRRIGTHYGPHRRTCGNPYELTSRELAVVMSIVEGHGTVRSIGEHLFLGKSTVQYHLMHAKDKMGCSSTMALAVKWVREQEHGWEKAA